MLKIIEVKKVKEPFKTKTGGTGYSVNAKCLFNGNELFANVTCYTPDIKLIAGLEIADDTRLKMEEKKYTDEEGNERHYKQITIYAEKKAGFQKGNYAPKEKYTQEEFEALLDFAYRKAKEFEKLDPNIVFEKVINNAPMYGVKIQNDDFFDTEGKQK